MRIFRFLKALFKYITHGHKVDFNEYVFRMRVCNECEHRNGWVCGKCGCYLDKKAKMDTEKCIEGNW